MINRFKPCMAILPPAQQRLWPNLAAAPRLGMVLYGGTAIALYLGHRPSVDFDFFTSNPLNKNTLHDHFPFLINSMVLQDEPNAYTVLVHDGEGVDARVKVSFFGDIKFGRVGEPLRTEDGVLQVASMDDLMATKVKVVLQRVEAKDYIDIAAMIKAGVSLAKGLASAKLIYEHSFQPSESLKAMVFFEGGDLAILTTETKNTLIKAVSHVHDLPHVMLMERHLSL